MVIRGGRDAESRIRPDCICSIRPQIGVVVPCFRSVEDPTIGRLVLELEWDGRSLVSAGADLISQVDRESGDEEVMLAVWKLPARGSVDVLGRGDIAVKTSGVVYCCTACAAGGLHGSGARPAAYYDGPDARFMVHHLYEQRAC